MARKRGRNRRGKAAGAQEPVLPLAPVQPRGPGQPTKYTPAVVERICELLRKGLPRTRAARRGGIAVSTFMLWMNEHSEFSEAVHNAEDVWVEKAMGRVTDMLDSKNERVALQAAKFGLSYRFREDFSKRIEQTGPEGGPVRIEHSGQIDAALRPLVTLEDLRKMTREETESTLLAEAERQDQANREESA